MPLTASLMISSGRRAMHLLERPRAQPARVAGVAVVALVLRLLPVTATFSALITTTKSPVSMCGVYSGLRLPRSTSAICVASAPERLAVSVDQQPIALAIGRLCHICLRRGSHRVKKATRQRAAQRNIIGEFVPVRGVECCGDRRRQGRRKRGLWVSHSIQCPPAAYSHSIVPGGFDVMSSTTRLTSRSSLIMREAIVSSRSYGSRAQSAVIASSLVTARTTTT